MLLLQSTACRWAGSFMAWLLVLCGAKIRSRLNFYAHQDHPQPPHHLTVHVFRHPNLVLLQWLLAAAAAVAAAAEVGA